MPACYHRALSSPGRVNPAIIYNDPLGRMHRAYTRIGSGAACPDRGPSVKFYDLIDNTVAELPIDRTGAIGPMFLQRSGR